MQVNKKTLSLKLQNIYRWKTIHINNVITNMAINF